MVRLDRAVDVGQPVIGIGARRAIIFPGRQGGILLGQRLERRADRHIKLGAALRVLARIVGRQPNFQPVGRPEQQLAAHRLAVDRVLMQVLDRIEDIAVPPRADERQPGVYPGIGKRP